MSECQHDWSTMPPADFYDEFPLFCVECGEAVLWGDGTIMTRLEWNAHYDKSGNLLPGVSDPSFHNPDWIGNKSGDEFFAALRRYPFTAIYEGVRYRFRVVEHANVGPGWMCAELDHRLNHIVSSHLLSEIVW